MLKKYKPKMTEEQRQAAVVEYLETNATLKEIAQKYDCSVNAIHKAVKKFKEGVEQ